MADINIEFYLDLQSIIDYNMLDPDMSNKKFINNELIHVLNLSEEKFQDYGGDSITIKGLRVNDNINLHLDDYSKYDSELSAIIVSYGVKDNNEHIEDYISPPSLVMDFIDRPYVSDSEHITTSIKFNKVNLSYWKSNIKRLDSPPLHYQGIVQIFRKNRSLGYAYFLREIVLTK